MLVVIGNKKIKILFYIFVFIFLSTISFFEKTKFFGNTVLFQLDKIEIYGQEKVDHLTMERKLNFLIGQNLLFINSKDIEEIVEKNKLVSEYTIQKKYPNTVIIKINEVNFVAKLIKDKKKYFLANNDVLIPFKNYLDDEYKA